MTYRWSLFTRVTGGGGALTLALLTGCAGDATVTDPAVALPTLTRDSLRTGFTVAPRLAITPANENRCESRAVQRDAGDRFVRWRPTVTEQVTVTRSPTDTVLTRYELYAFNPRGKQTGEAQCVLRRGAAASTFMRGFFERPGRPGMVGMLAAATATPVPEAVPPVFISAGTVCLFDVWSWQMQCGNTTCYPQFAVRVPTRAQRQGLMTDTATRASDPTSPLIGGWECPGMGNLSLNGDGTLTFHPDGGGGGGGGGTCGSGGGGGGGGDSSGDGSVNPPGGGGGATSWWGANCADTLTYVPTLCDPVISATSVDTTMACNRNRSRQEDSLIGVVRAEHFRVNFGTDSIAQRECTEMVAWLDFALADTNRVTNKQTFSVGINDNGNHWGTGISGMAHIDPRVFKAVLDAPTSVEAKRILAANLLHEPLHAWTSIDHAPLPSTGRYTDPYFKRLNPLHLDAQSCLR